MASGLLDRREARDTDPNDRLMRLIGLTERAVFIPSNGTCGLVY